MKISRFAACVSVFLLGFAHSLPVACVLAIALEVFALVTSLSQADRIKRRLNQVEFGIKIGVTEYQGYSLIEVRRDAKKLLRRINGYSTLSFLIENSNLDCPELWGKDKV